MVNVRSNEWEATDEVYSAAQVEAVLIECGVDIVGETSEVLTCLCPFHGNTDTYAFAVNKANGKYICFNPGCGKFGELVDLVRLTMQTSVFASYRLINRLKSEHEVPFEERFAQATADEPPFIEFEQEVIDRLAENFWATPHAVEYMRSRQFDDATLRDFEVGYSNSPHPKTGKPRNMVVVPMHDPGGMPVGLVGRTASHQTKDFRNSRRLPKKETLYNLHRARKHGETVIVVEASFDVMRVTQAGYPNVVAILGGSLSPWHIELLNKYFSTIIIMTDYDEKTRKICSKKCPSDCPGHRAGRVLGDSIASALKHKRVLWSLYSKDEVFPDGAKDPGDCSDTQIRACLKKPVSGYEYYSLPLAS